MNTKICSRCGLEKPLDEFNKRTRSSDGHRPECKTCQRQANSAYYGHGGQEVARTYYIRNREKILPRLRTRGGKTGYDPERSPARAAVARALQSGQLVRPDRCEQCNKPCKPEAHHHNGYDIEHRLDVQWLCRECHDVADHPEFAEKIKCFKS